MLKESKAEKTSKIISRIYLQISADGINFKEFIELIGEQGGLLSCLVLVSPFLFPVSFPGSSIPFGLAIVLINVGIITKSHPLIPKRIMDYKISQNTILKLLNAMARVLVGLEKFTKPRLIFLSDPIMGNINSSVMIFSAALLMLPLPVPLTDFLPAYSILFLALGSIENDGYLILVGYALTIVTAIYFLLIAILGISGLKAILVLLGINI